MTRARIIELLEVLVLELGNDVPAPNVTQQGKPTITAEEWAYIKGLASGRIMQLRDDLIAAGT